MKQTYFQLLSGIKDYQPADEHFTSKDEIDMLNKHFGLSEMTPYDLQNLRDFTVMFFDMQMDNETTVVDGCCTRTEQFYNYMTAMQSIVAVIDHFKYNC